MIDIDMKIWLQIVGANGAKNFAQSGKHREGNYGTGDKNEFITNVYLFPCFYL